MSAILEEKTQFRKIGNSLGIIVPASIRKFGGFNSGDEVTLECPRPGVITINSVMDAKKNKLESWNELTSYISEHKLKESAWPNGKSFKEVLNDARDERFEL